MRPISELLRTEAYSGNCAQHGPWCAEYSPFVASRMSNLCPDCVAERASEDISPHSADERAGAERRRFARARIPLRYQNCTFENFPARSAADEEAKAKALEYARDLPRSLVSGRSLLMMGPAGTGKTFLGVCILKHALELGKTARFLDVWSLVDLVEETYNDKTAKATKDAVLAPFIEADVLLLDHVVPCKGSAHEWSLVRQVIHRRHEGVKPTLLTTCLTIDELRARIAEAGLDRLREAGGTAIVFTGESHRRGSSHGPRQ